MFSGAVQHACFRKMVIAVAMATITASAAQASDHGRFERIKTLVGKWKGTSNSPKEGTRDVVFEYSLTAGGSVVVERQFVSSDHEMITMYYMSNDDLLLTHYCMLGNQPTMICTGQGGDDVVSFDFGAKTGVATEGDAHMRKAKIMFLAPDHIQSEWVLYKDGQQADVAIVDLKRVQ